MDTSYIQDPDEKDLIQKLQHGDEKAFTLVVDTYRKRMFQTVLNIVQDKDEAEDTLQDAFIKVFESIRQFRGGSSLSTWIYRIAVRKALDKVRKRKLMQNFYQLLPWWMPEENKDPGINFYHPGIALENKEKAAILYKAISKLPEKQKLAFTLIKVEKMSYQEAEEIMQQSIKAIESLISRAKQNLQKQLKEYYHEEKG